MAALSSTRVTRLLCPESQFLQIFGNALHAPVDSHTDTRIGFVPLSKFGIPGTGLKSLASPSPGLPTESTTRQRHVQPCQCRGTCCSSTYNVYVYVYR